MDINQIKNLLKKYQDNTCTEEERDIINRWLDEFAEEPEIVMDEMDVDSRLQQIKRQIGSSINTRTPYRWRYLKIAACILLFISIGTIFRIPSFNKPHPLAESNPKVNKLISNGWVKLRTTRGATYSFTLPDGSAVILNASSVLRYPLVFSRLKRPVYLDEGEAYFSVAKDKRRPFTVYTSRFATTALGTAFNVRTYSRERQVSVALIEGSVKVEDLTQLKKKTVFLNPHQKIVLNTITEQVTNKVFEDELLVSDWTQGLLSFENATAEEVIAKIENRFNVGIKKPGSHLNWNYTGSFKNETLNEVLQTVCLTEGVTYKYITKDSIQIN